MGANGTVLIALSSVLFSMSGVCAGGSGPRDAAAHRAGLEAISIATGEAFGALSQLLEEQGDQAEAGHRFQQRYAEIQQSVADNDTLNSRGGLIDDIQTSVLLEWFPGEKRLVLGRKLVALTQASNIEAEQFFDLITLGSFLVVIDGDDEYVAETSRKIADHVIVDGYDPGPLLQDLVTWTAMVDPDEIGSSEVVRRIYSFFFCLHDCLGPSGERGGEEQLVEWLDSSVLAYLCYTRGATEECSDKRGKLREWADEASFPRCPAS